MDKYFAYVVNVNSAMTFAMNHPGFVNMRYYHSVVNPSHAFGRIIIYPLNKAPVNVTEEILDSFPSTFDGLEINE